MTNDSKMSVPEAVDALDALDGTSDMERDHLTADQILLAVAPKAVREAYVRLVERSAWWVHA